MIRIAIVGCGRILNAHLQGYKKIREAGFDNFRITALVARKEEDALMFRRRGEGPTPRASVLPPETGDPLAAPHTYLSDFQDDVDVKVYTDYRQMLDEDEVDAVNDFTTLALHHQIADESFKRGKHLLTQKPLAISVKAAQQMVRQAKERGLTLGVFENVRQGTFTRAAGWAVRKGLIGTPQFGLMGSLGGLWSPDRVVADTPWRHYKLQGGGGGSIDIGVHQFHMLRYMLGEVAWVSATARTFEPTRYRRNEAGEVVETIQANVDDTYMAVAGFENQSIAQVLWSWAGQAQALTVPDAPAFYGSEGVIKGGKIFDAKGNESPLIETFKTKMSAEERDAFYPHGLTDAFAIAQWDWLDSIEKGKDPETSGHEGLMDLACAFGMLESSMARRQVTMEEILSGAVNGYQAEIDQHYGL